jgi:hypothetical protein
MGDSLPDRTGEEVETWTPKKFNQVEVRTTSGAIRKVKCVLRHPNREWAYANKVTDVTDGVFQSNDLVFRVGEIELIESEQTTSVSPERTRKGQPLDTYSEQSIWVHHSVPIDYISIESTWKAWPSDDQVKRFQTPEN